MPITKNTAGQYLYATLVSAVDGSAITAGAAIYLEGDGGTQAPGAGTLSHRGNGQWRYALTQADTNFNTFGYSFGGTSVVPQGGMVVTVDYPRNAIPAAQAGAASGLPTLDGSAHLLVYSVAQPVTAGAVTDKVGYSLTTPPPTLTQIVNGIWDEPKAGHITAGSFGLFLDATISSRSTYGGADTAGTATLLARLTAGRAAGLDNLDAAVSSRLATSDYIASADPWATALPGTYSPGTAGAILGTNLDAAVSTRLAATNYAAPADPWATALPGSYAAGTAGAIIAAGSAGGSGGGSGGGIGGSDAWGAVLTGDLTAARMLTAVFTHCCGPFDVGTMNPINTAWLDYARRNPATGRVAYLETVDPANKTRTGFTPINLD